MLLAVVGCKSNAERIEEILKRFKSRPITLCTADYMTLCSDSTYNPQVVNEATLKYIIYVDSSECSPCMLKNAYKWNDYIYKFNNDSISFSYIISSQNSREVIEQTRESGFCQAVFVDTACVFSKQNPHIPQESMYHVFLLDKGNNVVLVGNPLVNQAIEEEFLSIVRKTF